MKTTLQFLLTAIFVLTLFIHANAQDALVRLDEVITLVEKKEPVVEKTLSLKEIYLNHTQIATEQFVYHLNLNATYPDHLKNYCLEGNVIVEVVINKDSSIKEAKIIQSLQKEFDDFVLSFFKEIVKINIDNYEYKGARRIRIPVNFSLE